VTTTGPYVKQGKLKALAVTTAQPSPLVPGLPTIAQSGLPGYEAVAVFSMFAPAATPPALVNRLHEQVVRLLNKPDVKERFFNAGTEVIASSPAELAATMKAEIATWGRLFKEAGVGG
jgi:tripartite-type tricarboxylate transporter receptor subunit TctC